MKREELRIGNYIDNGGEPITVEFWMLDDLPYTLDGYKPIPLTEEWLKKFGFEDCGWEEINNYEKHHNYNIMINSDDDFICYLDVSSYGGIQIINWGIKDGDNYINPYYEIKYVHQLQNLYFVLTGKEL